MSKPIIRHCYNCKYYRGEAPLFPLYDCDVKYIDVLFPRIRALMCRYYTAEEGDT